MKLLITTLFLAIFVTSNAADSIKSDTLRIYQYNLLEDIGPDSWRKTQKAMKESREWKAGLILIHMNTYGGLLNAADSIRTAILNSEIPVWVFVDNNAASAGALISISAKKIFMKPGGSIGSATVVNQTGEPLPDKYQSYMRSLMRATAESHGADTIVNGKDTTIVWKRDPHIAEAMVDPDMEVEGISEKGKVLAFTTKEAIKHGYCDGEAKNKEEIIAKHVTQPYVVKKQELKPVDHIIHFFINPVIQGILIMLIIGGIYFELQTPGIGFPIAASIIATILYFVPLYIEGIAAHWEIIIFVIGVGLLIAEIFFTPGFGVLGTAGGLMMIAGLSMAMIDAMEFDYSPVFWGILGRSFFMVTMVSAVSLFGSIWLGGKLFTSSRFSNLALNTVQNTNEGYIGIDETIMKLAGMTGIATTDLRPSGTIEVNGKQYDAKALDGFVETGTKIRVVKVEMAQLYVREVL
jgi:membrane-bound serine protease (ClpP class)